MKRILIYGCGADYRTFRECVRAREKAGEFTVAGVSARELPPGDTLDGWPLIPREKLDGTPFDAILILSYRYEEEIRREFMERGIPADRILTGQDLYDAPSPQALERLARERVTILTNICFGGVVYRTLGLECCSPTKNLWIYEMEFFKLLEHPEDYLFRTPVFLEWGEGHAAYEEARYPVLSLGDIRLFCNHDTDPDEAIAKWVRRAKKVNLKNVLALLFTQYPQLERRFYGIRGRMRKTCFVPYESGDPRTITITPVPGKDWLSTVMKHAYPGTPLDLYALVSGRGQVLPKTRNA